MFGNVVDVVIVIWFLIYVIERVPKVTFAMRWAFYVGRIRAAKRKLRDLEETAAIRADLEWEESGRKTAERYFEERDAPLIISHIGLMEIEGEFKNFIVACMTIPALNEYGDLLVRVAPGRSSAHDELNGRRSEQQDYMAQSRDHLMELGYDIDDLEKRYTA